MERKGKKKVCYKKEIKMSWKKKRWERERKRKEKE